MPDRSDAIRYARAGYAIIPVHTVNPDGSCSCGDPHTRSQTSIGKHPLTIHGVSNATRRGSTITEWFTEPHNIGIACGPISNGLGIADIDDTALATAILRYFTDNPDILRPPVSLTTRGIHLWFICPNEPNSKLTRIDGVHLGEIRAHDQYAIGPPSCTVANGEPRRWWGQDGDAIPEAVSVDSIRDYIETTCRIVGTELAPERGPVDIGDRPETIEAIALPFKARKTVLKNILAGKYPTDDRSGVLFRLVREVQEQAERDGYAISIAELAGIAKAVDRAHYHKYDGASDGRVDGDQRYWEVASRGGVEGLSGAAQSATGASGAGNAEVTAEQGHRYRWSSADGVGKLVYVEGKRETDLANFKPEVIRKQEVLHASSGETTASYILRVIRADDSERELELTERDLSSDALQRAVHRQLGNWGSVMPRGWGHLWNAAQEFGPNPTIEHTYGDLGWNLTPDNRDVILLPHAECGITADGFDPTIHFYGFPAEKTAAYVRSYGHGVRPAESRSEQSLLPILLRELFATAPPHVLLPIFTSIFGAPLLSLGLSEAPPLVHIVGLTGHGKTSLCAAVLSVFGDFYKSTKPTLAATWLGSSPKGLSVPLHIARDLPMLIDDYKVIQDRKKMEDVATMVHNYAEGTSASTMQRNREAAEVLKPQAMWLSTGQDTWDTQSSTAGRTINVAVEKGDIPKSGLTVIMNRVIANDLQLLGGTYLRWLARTGSTTLRPHIHKCIQNERAAINIPVHDHLLSMIAALRTVEHIVGQWIADEVPAFADEFTASCAANAEMVTRQLRDVQQREKTLAPAQQLLDTLSLHILAEDVRMVNRNERSSLDRYLNGAARNVAGFFDDEYLYLTKELTYSWYCKELRTQGLSETSSWEQICTDAGQTLGLATKYQMHWARMRRAIQVPLDLVGDAQTVRGMLRQALQGEA